jgi:glutamate-ammonia-ligase adenylyltransferase
LPEKSRLIFDNLVRSAADALMSKRGAAEDIDKTLSRFFDLLEAIARRSAYLSILAEYPGALSNVLSLLQSSQWGAQYLISHPHLLDYLLNPNMESALIDHPEDYWREVKANLDMRLDECNGRW